MPMIGTFGVLSARAFGSFLPKLAGSPIGSGSGIFAAATDTTGNYTKFNLYNFSNNTTSSSSNYSVTTVGGCAAAGNTTLGIFARGYSPTKAVTSAIGRLTIASSTYVNDSNVFPYGGTVVGAAFGNISQGIFAQGSSPTAASALTCAYTYSSSTIAAGNSLTIACFFCAAIGSPTGGIIAHDENAARALVTTTNRFQYSDGTIVAGTSLTDTPTAMATVGNSTLGVFSKASAPGTNSAVSLKYVFSGNVTSTGTALTINTIGSSYAGSMGSCGVSCDTFGVFHNQSGQTQKYIFSGDTIGAGPSLGDMSADTGGGAISPSVTGINT